MSIDKKLRIAFLTQTNTALPVLAYLSETKSDEFCDIIFVNGGSSTDLVSKRLREVGVKKTALAVAPHAYCVDFDSDLKDYLRINVHVLRKIQAIRKFKRELRLIINQQQQIHAVDPKNPIVWVADVGIEPWTRYGRDVVNANLVLVPHEMRHFNEYASRLHYQAFAFPGTPGSFRRLTKSYWLWLVSLTIGCRRLAPYWPSLLNVPHVSYVQPLDWHPKAKVMPGIHNAEWYRKHVPEDLRVEPASGGFRAIFLLSQIQHQFNDMVKKVCDFLASDKIPPNAEIDIKMHPTEPGYWEIFCQAVEEASGILLRRDYRINLYPSELWLGVVHYDLAIGEGTGAIYVAREIYNIPTMNLTLVPSCLENNNY